MSCVATNYDLEEAILEGLRERLAESSLPGGCGNILCGLASGGCRWTINLPHKDIHIWVDDGAVLAQTSPTYQDLLPDEDVCFPIRPPRRFELSDPRYQDDVLSWLVNQ